MNLAAPLSAAFLQTLTCLSVFTCFTWTLNSCCTFNCWNTEVTLFWWFLSLDCWLCKGSPGGGRGTWATSLCLQAVRLCSALRAVWALLEVWWFYGAVLSCKQQFENHWCRSAFELICVGFLVCWAAEGTEQVYMCSASVWGCVRWAGSHSLGRREVRGTPCVCLRHTKAICLSNLPWFTFAKMQSVALQVTYGETH